MVIALAIGKAIELVFLDRDTMTFNLDDQTKYYLAPLLAFLVTLIPFFHGMNRHLDECYIIRSGNRKEGALLFDFTVFFAESSLLFICATSLKAGLTSFVVLGLMLSTDTIWAMVSHWIHYHGLRNSVKKWAVVNLAFMLLGALIYLTPLYSDTGKSVVLAIIFTTRTIVDYATNWRFYFPEES